jgi:hypothetical protein
MAAPAELLYLWSRHIRAVKILMTSNLAEASFAFIMAIVFATIGWRAAIAKRNRLALWASARNWPTASGRILDVGVDVVTKSHHVGDRLLFETSYRPRIAYSYSVGNQTYTGTRFDCTDGEGYTQMRTRSQVSKYSPGELITIAYDPEDPLNSVLDRTIKPSQVADSALSIYLGFFAAIFLTVMGLRILALT